LGALCQKSLNNILLRLSVLVTIDTENEVIRGKLGPHEHLPASGERERRLIIARMFEQVRTELTDLSVIYSEETRG